MLGMVHSMVVVTFTVLLCHLTVISMYFKQGTVSKRKCRRAVRKANNLLKQKLVAVREEVYNERPSFSIVGICFLCPDSTIHKICEEAK